MEYWAANDLSRDIKTFELMTNFAFTKSWRNTSDYATRHDILCNQVKKSVIQDRGGFTQLNSLKVAQRLNQSWDLVICNLFFFFSFSFFFWGGGVRAKKLKSPGHSKWETVKDPSLLNGLIGTPNTCLDFAFLRLKFLWSLTSLLQCEMKNSCSMWWTLN